LIQDHSYEPFTRHAFYQEVNQILVRRAIGSLIPPVGRVATVVDLGCGTGAITQMVIDALQSRQIEASIIAIEPSAEALASARTRLAGSPIEVRFIHGDASQLPGRADAVFLCNAIHLIDNKDATIARIADAVVPGGLFAFNSAFFTGAYVAGSENFYRLWTIRALQWLRGAHPDVTLTRKTKATAMQWLSQQDYERLLEDHGFTVLSSTLDEVLMTLESFQDIGRYRLFIEGALPGVPLDAGGDALHHGAAQVFEQQRLSAVPRNWLQVVARRAAT
jgi:ubiquinone/menaquinone biosynthesis C-methylase UbiE